MKAVLKMAPSSLQRWKWHPATTISARIFALGLCLLTLSVARAGDWPNSPIHIIVPFTPGASTDVVIRTVAPKFSELIGAAAVVENRAGAGGLIATESVATANPDGYTVLVVTTSFAAQPAIIGRLPYDTAHDFAPIALLADLPGVLVINPKVPIKTFSEFLPYAKSHRLTYGSAGIGTFPHLGMELLKSRAGIPMTHVPYKGASQALADVIGGQIDVKLDAYVSSAGHLADGTLRALAVTSLTRLPELPDVPTIAESGFPGFEVTYWIGIVVPAAVPESVRTRLQEAFISSLTPENKALLAKQGVRVVGGGQNALQSLINRELAQWQKLAAETDLSIK